MRPGVPDIHITDSQDPEMAEYRPLAGQAVVALLISLLSPLAFFAVSLWAIPLLGIIFGWWALRRIKKYSPDITGRKMAVTGLLLSLLMFSAASSNWIVYRLMVRHEAQQFVSVWVRYINQNDPQKAFQLTLPASMRVPIDAGLSDAYRTAPRLSEYFEKYIARQDIRTLLELGPKAQIRYYDIADLSSSGLKDTVRLLYTVTYEEDNEKKSFFLMVEADRFKNTNGHTNWRIVQSESPYQPEG